MSGCKIVKTIFSVITIASFVLLLTQYKADLLSIWYSDPNLANTGISFSASIKSTYGSFSFLFFIFGLSFPLIAAFINNKTASLVLSSLSFAFLIPYVFELTQYYFDTYMSLSYNGLSLAKCSLNDNYVIVLVGVGLLLVSSLTIFVSSIFAKEKQNNNE